MTISKCCGSGGSSAPSQDRFAPKYVVGNALAGDSAAAYASGGFTFIEDPGDGTGIEAALALAAVTIGDIALRPGVYDFSTGAVVMPLSVPAGVRVSGSGAGSCELRSRTAGDQGIFVLEGARAGVEDIAFTVQSSGEALYSGSSAVIVNQDSDGGYVFRCTFSLSLAATSVLRACIQDAGAGSFSVRQCYGTGPSVGGSDADLWIAFVVAAKTGSGRLTASGNAVSGFDVPLLCDDAGGVDDILIQDLSATGYVSYAVYQRGFGFLGMSDCSFQTETASAGGVVFGAAFAGSGYYPGSYIVDSTITSQESAQTQAAVLIRSGSDAGYARVQNCRILWPRIGASVVVGTASGSCNYNLVQNNQIFNPHADPAATGVQILNGGCNYNIVSTNVIVASVPINNGNATTQILGNTP